MSVDVTSPHCGCGCRPAGCAPGCPCKECQPGPGIDYGSREQVQSLRRGRRLRYLLTLDSSGVRLSDSERAELENLLDDMIR